MSILSSTRSGKFGIKVTPEVLCSYGLVPHDYFLMYNVIYWCYKNKTDCIVNYMPSNGDVYTTFQSDICYISNIAELEVVIDFFNAKTKEEKRELWNKLKKMR